MFHAVAKALLGAALLDAATAVQVLGSVATLQVANKVIAPDGVSRSTVLAGGTFPGPLISGSPVRTI
jgi:iron transport multicopper oxidase